MTVVIDASVAVKWFLSFKPDEGDADRAMLLLRYVAGKQMTACQPPHFLTEVAAVLAREKPSEAHDDLLDMMALDFQTIADADVYATAVDLAVQYQHHLFDTLYHAVALHTPNACLITADRRYYDKSKGAGCIALLEDWHFV